MYYVADGHTEAEVIDESVCVIVPMYNEATMISEVVRGLRGRFRLVICVDDGSQDDSLKAARLAGAEVIRHPINLGQGAALRTGIEFALRLKSVEYLVTFDADGQHLVSDAERLVEICRAHDLDVVLGSRFLRNGDRPPSDRRWILAAAVIFTRITTGLRVTDTHNGLRVFSREAAQRLEIHQAGMAHASEILNRIARLGLPFVEEQVSITYTDYSRAKGQGNLNAINILHDLFTARLRAAR